MPNHTQCEKVRRNARLPLNYGLQECRHNAGKVCGAIKQALPVKDVSRDMVNYPDMYSPACI